MPISLAMITAVAVAVVVDTAIAGPMGAGGGEEVTNVNAIALDIETMNIPEPQLTELVAAEMAEWEPPANLKDEAKIEARRAEAAAKIRQRSALRDASPIGMVCVCTVSTTLVFVGIPCNPIQIPGASVAVLESEHAMLLALRTWMDSQPADQSILVGFNLLAFDLPRLRHAYTRQRLRLPEMLRPPASDEQPQPAADVMRMYASWFSADKHRQPFVALGEVTKRLGLPQHKTSIDGAQVPEMLAQGKVREVTEYSLCDTIASLAAYLLLSGQSQELR